jgi:transcriptional regulator with XRE-family HTH domain
LPGDGLVVSQPEECAIFIFHITRDATADVALRRESVTEEGARAIGERLAHLRKERGVTQVEMADLLGVSQGNVSDYERGELRLHGELLVKLARVLKVSADEILGLEVSPPTRAPRDRRLLRRLQDIDKLSKRDREALVRTLDAFLSKAQPG